MLKFKTKPRKHQEDALRISWNKPFFALLMDRGTGKTKVVIDTAAILYEKDLIQGLLVIAPNDVHERWVTEQIPLHMPDHIKILARVWKSNTSKKYLDSLRELFTTNNCLRILTMNIEAFQTKKGQALAQNFCHKIKSLVCVDESTRIKTPGAKRTKAIITLGRSAPYRRILTGNEVTNTPFDVYSQFKFLALDFWGINFFLFQHRYAKYTSGFASVKNTKKDAACSCGYIGKAKVVRFFNQKKQDWDCYFKCARCEAKFEKLNGEMLKLQSEKGLYTFPVLEKYINLDELKRKVAPYSFRVEKKDCLDLPPKIYDPIYCELNPKQKQVYEQLKQDLYVEHEEEELTVMNKMTLGLRFQQIVGGFFPTDDGKSLFLGSPKMDRILYDLEDIDCDAIIIWAVFRAELQYIWKTLRQLDERTELFYGDTPKDKRKQIVTDFQEGKIRFLVANPDSAGTGLNLQRSNLHYYYSNSFKAENRWQSEDRSHRDGQHWPVVYKDVFIKGTVDDTIKKAVETKTNMAAFFRQPLREVI